MMVNTYPLNVKTPKGAVEKRLILPTGNPGYITLDTLIFGEMVVYRSFGSLKNGWTVSHRRTAQAALVNVSFPTAIKYARLLDKKVNWSRVTFNRETWILNGWDNAIKREVARIIEPVRPGVLAQSGAA